jgi:uncharacterized protein YjbJ (UPF0337 family)
VIVKRTLFNYLKAFVQQTRTILGIFFLGLVAVIVTGLGWNMQGAIAQPLVDFSNDQPAMIALDSSHPLSDVEDKAQRDLDRVFGSGTSNKIEGAAEETFGRAKRQVDGTVNQADGASRQIEGRAKRDIGRTQSSAEKLGEDLKESTENAVDSVRDLFR